MLLLKNLRKKPAGGIQKSKNAFSMQQIAKVLDKANKADIKLLKDHWQEVIDHAKNNDKNHSLVYCKIRNLWRQVKITYL